MSRLPVLVLSALLAAVLGVGLLTATSTAPSRSAALSAPQTPVVGDAPTYREMDALRASRQRQLYPVPHPRASRSARPVHPPHRKATVTFRVPKSALKRYALHLVGSRTQFACLDRLWTAESHWGVTESYGSAYGIPQAKPGRKMASAGADWRTNGRTQIRWGLGYIADRYGTPCAAWRHYQRLSWY